MNFFVLTVTDESDMLADSCGREGRLAEQEAAMHKARRRLRAVGKRRQTTFCFHTVKTTRVQFSSVH